MLKREILSLNLIIRLPPNRRRIFSTYKTQIGQEQKNNQAHDSSGKNALWMDMYVT